MTDSENLYLPPKGGREVRGPKGGPSEPARTPFVEASRLVRLGGATIDAAFAGGLLWVFSWAGARLLWGDPSEALATAPQHDWRYGAVLVATVGVTFGVQGWLIALRGQSIGKIVMKTRIVRPDGRVAGFLRGFVLRTLPFNTILLVALAASYFQVRESVLRPLSVIATVAAFVDSMWILGPGARCFHDRLAETYVEKVRSEPLIADADAPSPRGPKKRTKKSGSSTKQRRAPAVRVERGQ